MRVALLGRDGWHAGRLVEALRRRGHRAELIPWAALEARLTETGAEFGPEPVAGADVVVVRGMPGAGPEADGLEQVVFRMDVLARLEAAGTPVVNRSKALEVAIDKYLTLAVLAAAGLRVPRTFVVQEAAAARRALEALGGVCVSKPLFGSRGRGMTLVRDDETAVAAGGSGVRYLQEFIRHDGWDLRILIVGDGQFAMRRVARAGEWRTNLACGGRPEPAAPDQGTIDVARRAAAAVGARIAGVDLIPTPDGPVVLEVNAIPAWRGLQTVTEADLTAAVTAEILRAARPAP